MPSASPICKSADDHPCHLHKHMEIQYMWKSVRKSCICMLLLSLKKETVSYKYSFPLHLEVESGVGE